MTGKAFKRLRTAKGYSQSELARALGVATLTVSQWETGRRSIFNPVVLALKSLPKKTKGKPMKVSLNPLWIALQAQALKEDRSASSILIQLIRRYLQQRRR